MPRPIGRGGKGERRRSTAGIALAAMLVQLVVSAWHIHPEDFAFLAQANTSDRHAASSTTAPGTPGREDCALCFTLHLAVGKALADAAGPTLPAAAKAPPLLLPPALHLASAPYLLFRTRAPPLAA